MFKIGDIVRLKNYEKTELNKFGITKIQESDNRFGIEYYLIPSTTSDFALKSRFSGMKIDNVLISSCAWSEDALEPYKYDEPKLKYSLNDANNLTIKLSPTDSLNYIKMPETMKMNYNYVGTDNYEKKEEKDYMKILDIYRVKKLSEIEHEKNEEKDKVMEQDEMQKILLKAIKEINELLPENEEFNYKNENLLTDATKKKIYEIDAKAKEKKDEVDRTIEEVKALFELTGDYTERIKILEKYGIMKNGKING